MQRATQPPPQRLAQRAGPGLDRLPALVGHTLRLQPPPRRRRRLSRRVRSARLATCISNPSSTKGSTRRASRMSRLLLPPALRRRRLSLQCVRRVQSVGSSLTPHSTTESMRRASHTNCQPQRRPPHLCRRRALGLGLGLVLVPARISRRWLTPRPAYRRKRISNNASTSGRCARRSGL